MILKRITAGIIAATIAGTGVVTMSAVTAAPASAATVSAVSTAAPLLGHKWRCVWIGKKGKIHFGKSVRSATIKWRNGHWVVKKSNSCQKTKKWRW